MVRIYDGMTFDMSTGEVLEHGDVTYTNDVDQLKGGIEPPPPYVGDDWTPYQGVGDKGRHQDISRNNFNAGLDQVGSSQSNFLANLLGNYIPPGDQPGLNPRNPRAPGVPRLPDTGGGK